MKLKRNIESIMCKCLIGFLIGLFMRTIHIPELEGNLQEFGRMWRVSECEELVGYLPF